MENLYMNLFEWLKKYKKGLRLEAREKITDDIFCIVSFENIAENLHVVVCDLSRNGLGFLTMNPDPEVIIGSLVNVLIIKNTEIVCRVSGEIVGQDIFYVPGGNDPRKGHFRFSIRFDEPIGASELNALKGSDSQL